MELIQISESKLKIMLAPEDLLRYELDPVSADWDYACTETRRALRTIFNEVREQTGFNAGDGRILLQFYPSRAGGCELFVTRLAAAAEECSCGLRSDPPESDPESVQPPVPEPLHSEAPDRQPNEAPQEALPVVHRSRPPERRLAFSFSTLDALLGACRRLHALPYRGESAAYADAGRWYLLLQEPGYPVLPDPLGFLTEYGTAVPIKSLTAYLAEHARVLCAAGAVERLSEL
jgi:negative regulator of genetic competence, sporulation and motility